MLTWIELKEMAEFVKCAAGTIGTLKPVSVSFTSFCCYFTYIETL